MLALNNDPCGSQLCPFESGLKSSLCGREELLDLKEIDMLFLPLVEGKHFYLVVFDLYRYDIYLIDHMADGESDVSLRDHDEYVCKTTPFRVKHILVAYLELVKHPKAAIMCSTVIRRESLAWTLTRRGASPNVDSAIFTMRYMERFLGTRCNFFCGFSSHGSRKKAQCNYLCKKYASQILLSAVNKYHGGVRHRIDRK
ncbi:putative papain-like cysteine peptidase superfamily [Helianthus annuus]|uniref:Papain-like cysteine peptidase superfamily n=1 Tax=Helianthus annuus TaxID=4232 RepID=A0A251RXK6_HELAN|nr:putative papain-like cysteine peptidase superfamily [Helianthus annuus]